MHLKRTPSFMCNIECSLWSYCRANRCLFEAFQGGGIAQKFFSGSGWILGVCTHRCGKALLEHNTRTLI